MTRFLLDVNLVLALLDPKHVFHEAAHAWLQNNAGCKLLTSPIVQNGVIRVASQSSYPNCVGTTSVARDILAAFCSRDEHEFCADSVSILDAKNLANANALTPSRVTDIYLLMLALNHDAKLATFDRRIPAKAVAGGANALFVISA